MFWIELTAAEDGKPVLVNIEKAYEIYVGANGHTRVDYDANGEGFRRVKETPEEIMELCRQIPLNLPRGEVKGGDA